MLYRRYGIILVFLLSAGQTFCGEPINADFLRSLNTSMSQANNTYEGLLLFPGVYFNRKNQTYAGFGLMIDCLEMLQKYEDENEQMLHQADTLMRLALFFRRSKTNLTMLFNYHRDNSWGVNCRVRL